MRESPYGQRSGADRPVGTVSWWMERRSGEVVADPRDVQDRAHDGAARSDRETHAARRQDLPGAQQGTNGARVEERDRLQVEDHRGDAVACRVDDRIPELLPVVRVQ